MKVLLHSNAPWSPSGYGQQVALFAPRLARRVGLVAERVPRPPRRPPAAGRASRCCPASAAPTATRASSATRSRCSAPCAEGVVLTLLDVPALDPQVWTLAGRRVLAAGRPRSGAAVGGRVLRADRRDPDRDVALRTGPPRGVRSAVRPARHRHALFHAARGARASGSGLPASAFVVGAVAMNKGVPVAQVAAADRRGVRRLPRPPRRGAAVPAHRGHRPLQRGLRPAAAAGRVRARRGRGRAGRSVPLPVRPAPPGAPGRPLQLVRRAAQPRDGRGLRAADPRGAGVRRAGDRHRLHRDERGLRRRLEGRLRPRADADALLAGVAEGRRDRRRLEACYALPEADRRGARRARPRARAALRRRHRVRAHWLPALDAIEQRLADRAPIRIPARAA